MLINEIAPRSKHSNPISSEGFAGNLEPNRDVSNHTPKTIRTNRKPPLRMQKAAFVKGKKPKALSDPVAEF